MSAKPYSVMAAITFQRSRTVVPITIGSTTNSGSEGMA